MLRENYAAANLRLVGSAGGIVSCVFLPGAACGVSAAFILRNLDHTAAVAAFRVFQSDAVPGIIPDDGNVFCYVDIVDGI